jgi:hypothetical protein
MTTMLLPDDGEGHPSLGPHVCAWIEQNLVFGPGDLQGKPARLDDEKRALIYRFYELLPQGAKDDNGKPIEGRRRFRRCAVSLQKGSAKTELAAWIAAAELHPEAPVRFDHFDAHGRPWGRGLPSAYIPLVAYTEEQSEDLAYSVLKDVLERSPIAGDFDIGWERIMRAGDTSSKAMPLAGAPDSRDGALTTFQHVDESHRWTLPRLKRAHRTMLANLTKRLLAEPWELETTTAYSPGEESVAEDTAHYAAAVAEGRISDSRLFYFHRQASDGYDWTDPDQRRRALMEAAGPTAAWKDIDGINDQWQDPKADFPYLERVFGNRPVASAAQAFDSRQWATLERPGYIVPDGSTIVLGFDGSINNDHTALVGTEVATGHQWVVGYWLPELEPGGDLRIPFLDVDAAVEAAFERWHVWRLNADPFYWKDMVASWAGRYGSTVVIEAATNKDRWMAHALLAYRNAMHTAALTHDGNQWLASAIGNAHRRVLPYMLDDKGQPMWVIQKERPDSPKKIDAAMAGCLSWQAYTAAVAEGAERGPSIYERQGVEAW